MESSSRIPFSTRAKNITVNSIRGLNFDDISTDTLIKKIDANNAGNSNIKNSFTASGSVTQLLNGDPNGLITNIGGEIITSLIGGDAKMELTVGEAGGKRSIILQENQAIVIEDDLSVTGALNSNSLSVTNGIVAKDITATGLIQGLNLHASAGITGTTITSSGAMNANSLSVTNGIATTDITATGLVQGNTVAAIGSLIVNGTINLNGTTGTAGAVLTSNGASDPTWLEKINLFAYKTADTTGIAYNVDTVVIGYTTSVESTIGSFNTTTGEFTAPRAGLYKIETFITVKDGSVPNIATGDVFINVYSGGAWSRFKTVILSMNNTDTDGITLSNSAIIQLALNDKIRVSSAVRTGGGGTSDIIASSGALNKLTSLAIHSID